MPVQALAQTLSSAYFLPIHPLREPLSGTGLILGTGAVKPPMALDTPYYLAGKQDTE